MQKFSFKEIIVVYSLITFNAINARLYQIPYRNRVSGSDDENLDYEDIDSNYQRQKIQRNFDSYDQDLYEPSRGKTQYFSDTNFIDEENDDDDSPDYVRDAASLLRTTPKPNRRRPKKYIAKPKLPHYSMWDLV